MALGTDLRSVAGLLPVSMVDWEGKLASVLFLKGCNLRCPYCHNPELVRCEGGHISWSDVEDHLREKRGWIDGVVLTGGEPTFSPDLRELILRTRALNLTIKLDTNGTRPELLKELLDDGLLDYVAMDIKAPFSAYDAVTRVRGQAKSIQAAIEVITSSGVDHEFRTTMVPGFFDPGELAGVASYLRDRGARRYFLQQFNPGQVLEPALQAVKPFPSAVLDEAAQACSRFIPTQTRGKL